MTNFDLLPLAQVGQTGLRVTRLAFGGVPLGNFPSVLAETDAQAALLAAWDAGIRYFDVAPLYGHGLAEHRIGSFLRGKRRDDFVLSSKVGRLLKPERTADIRADPSAGIFRDPLPFSIINDYSYDGIMRSVEDSLQRMGLARIDILHIHNIDPANHAPEKLEILFSQCMSDGYRALDRLRSDGTVSALGVGNNDLGMCRRFGSAGDFDCFMMAGHLNLLDQGALAHFLPECRSKGTTILLGSPFASGLLAAKNPAQSKYMYDAPSPQILARVETTRRICEAHGADLIAAALQYPARHPSVGAVVPGMRTAEEVRQCVAAFKQPLPEALWRDLESVGTPDPGSGVEGV